MAESEASADPVEPVLTVDVADGEPEGRRAARRRSRTSSLHPTALVVAVVGVALAVVAFVFAYQQSESHEYDLAASAADELVDEIGGELAEIDELLVGMRGALTSAEDARAQLPAITEVAVARSEFLESVSVLRFDEEAGVEIDAFGEPSYARIDAETQSSEELAEVTARLQELETSPTDELQIVARQQVDGDTVVILSTRVESTRPDAAVPEWVMVAELRFPAEALAALQAEQRGDAELALSLSVLSSADRGGDAPAPEEDLLIFSTADEQLSGDLHRRPVELYDHPGVLIVSIGASPLSRAETVRPLLVLLGGLAIVAVLTPLVNRLAVRREEIQLLSAQRDDLDEALAVSQQVSAELRASEGRFRSILHSTPDVIMWIDADDGDVQVLNRDNLLGHPLHRVTNTSALAALVHPDDGDIAREGMAALRASEVGVITQFECRFRRSDDEWEWLRIRGGRVEREDEEHDFILGVLTNITQHKREENRRAALERQLVQSQRLEAIGQLAGGVAHDFKNILAAILSGTDLLEDQVAGTARSEVDEIRRTAVRGSDIAAELLQFSRRDRGASPEVVDLNGVIRDVHTMLSRSLDDSTGLELNLSDGLYPIHIDPSQIERVLMNLTINARDAMPGGGTITIDTRNVDADDEMVLRRPLEPDSYACLEVSDTGEGMTEEVARRVFEPFYSTKQATKGTGLGLATVYGIVQGAQGHIDVDSAPGEGTSFTVLIPRTRLTSASPSSPDDSEGTPAFDEVGGTRILVVDPDDEVRRSAADTLADAGYLVSTASTGEEAADVGETAMPDVLVTDAALDADCDGHQLGHRLRQAHPSLRILYFSDRYDAALEAIGVDEDPSEALILRKPFDADSLRRAVRAAIEQRMEPTI